MKFGSLGMSALAIGLLCVIADGRSEMLEVNAEQIARLGVALGFPEPVGGLEIVNAPAQVVVPPGQQTLVSAPVGGRIARLLVGEGEAVTKGQAVAELESPDLLDWQRDYVDAFVEHQLAASQRDRDRSLFAEGIIAERRVQEAAARARIAKTRLDQADQQLRLAGYSPSAIEQLVDRGALSLSLTMRAPQDGFVLERYTEVGTRVDALDPVLRIAALDTLWLELRLPQENAADVVAGMLAVVTAGGMRRTGTVTMVGQRVDPTTQTLLVRAAIENPSAALKAGQFLTAVIVAPAAGRDVFAIPVAAAVRRGSETFVFVQGGNGFDVQRVEVLAQNSTVAYVSGAIDASAPIAVEGISALKSLWLALQEGS